MPEPADTSKCNDALSMLLALLSKKNQQDAESGVENVDTAKSEQEHKLEEAQAAYRKMKEAESDPMGWLGNVFKAVVAVASAIATVATGGAASPALTASAMAFGGVVQQTQCLGDLSNVIGEGANLFAGLGTGNLALVLGSGTSFTGAVGTATHDFDSTAATALNLTGKCIGMFGSFAPRSADGDVVGAQLGRDGKIVGLTGDTSYRVDRVIRDGDAANSAIDMKQAQQAMARVSRLIGALIDGVKEAHNSHNKAVRAVEGAIETNNQTALVAAGVRG
jgi:hypothetical protein